MARVDTARHDFQVKRLQVQEGVKPLRHFQEYVRSDQPESHACLYRPEPTWRQALLLSGALRGHVPAFRQNCLDNLFGKSTLAARVEMHPVLGKKLRVVDDAAEQWCTVFRRNSGLSRYTEHRHDSARTP